MFENSKFGKIGTNITVPDIPLPALQASVRSITRFIRQELRLDSIYIRGEIVHENENIVLTLRNISGINAPLPVERVVTSSHKIEQLFPKGGKSLLKLTQPTLMILDALNNLEHQSICPSKENNSIRKVFKAIKYCLKYEPVNDDKLAYILWGLTLNDIGEYEEAIEKFEKAIEINPNAAYAYSNLGKAHHHLHRYEEAKKNYEKAIEINPKAAIFYSDLGKALLALGSVKEGNDKIKTSECFHRIRKQFGKLFQYPYPSHLYPSLCR